MSTDLWYSQIDEDLELARLAFGNGRARYFPDALGLTLLGGMPTAATCGLLKGRDQIDDLF